MAVLPDDSIKRRSQVSRSSWGEDEEGRDEDESWGSYHWDEKDGNTTHTAVGECKGGRAVQADGVKAPRPALVMSRRKGEGSGVEEGVVVDRHPDARCLIPASVAQRCERDTEKCQSCHETLSRGINHTSSCTQYRNYTSSCTQYRNLRSLCRSSLYMLLHSACHVLPQRS